MTIPFNMIQTKTYKSAMIAVCNDGKFLLRQDLKMPQIDLHSIQRRRNKKRMRRHFVLGTFIVLVMFGIGASLLVLGIKFNIEDVWLLGAIFLGLIVLLVTVTSIAVAVPTYTTYRHRKKVEKEKLRLDKQCNFPDIHYERVETSHENSNIKLINSVLESLGKNEENENSDRDTEENGEEENEEQVHVEQVEVETVHIENTSKTGFAGAQL
ncbi:hypothetical protein KUTeg_010546 [Tegillarca granosa]|uniref:Uncharacterized protein n=1 Tax=Tegillarca granosa TaxID=220873 RepID=A0ABQ9F3C4_TEGGR|nr:hypothetical protein KUTeg_010546 [Tegillarca granosa]